MRISRAGWVVSAMAFACMLAAGSEAGPRRTGATRDISPTPNRLADASAGQTCEPDLGQFPANVQIDRRMLPQVATMLSRSRTFRDQCAALAARPWVYVRVLLKHDELLHGLSAQSVIRRTTGGQLLAFVDVGWRTDWSEWLAHEFEHVLEQAEGGSMAAFKISEGTWRSSGDAFESDRAINAGRDVRTQVRLKPAMLER